jgi:hypothetical protein
MLTTALASCCLAAVPEFRPETLGLTYATAPPRTELLLHLCTQMPSEQRLLRVRGARFDPCVNEHGDRLAATTSPDVRPSWHRPLPNVLRLAIAIAPPPRSCRTLAAIRGTVELLVTTAPPATRELAPEAVTLPEVAGATITVIERKKQRLVLMLSAPLAERFDGITVEAGRVQTEPLPDGSARVTVRDAEAKRLTLRWHPQAQVLSVPVSIPRLDLPGGIPGTPACPTP